VTRTEKTAVAEEIFKIAKAHKLGLEPERIGDEGGLVDRLPRGPEEKHKGDKQLRSDQQVWQPAVVEYDTFFHGSPTEKGNPAKHEASPGHRY